MYRIGEFSRITELSVKTLRFYHEEGLLLPSHVDEATGYRYYGETEYHTARRIRLLRELEFSLDEIREALPGIRSEEDLNWYLNEKALQLEAKAVHYKQLKRRIETLCAQKEAITMHTIQSIDCVAREPQNIASIRFQGRYNEVGPWFSKLFGAVGGAAAGPAMAIYHDDDYKEENADIECCVAVRKPISKAEVNTRVLEGGTYLKAIYTGPYEEISNAYKALLDYAEKNDLRLSGGSINVFVKGPGMLFKGNPNEYVTEVWMPVAGE